LELFDTKSKFYDKCDNILSEGFGSNKKYLKHPYTDVYALKHLFDFSCMNFSCGYYNYHRKDEYVVVEDVENALTIGKRMIEELGYEKYLFKK
jgi:acetylornithine deacetylase/succinyl-diaminopimelate desuccinylase-like protein